MTILLLGGSGLAGGSLRKLLSETGQDYKSPSSNDLNLLCRKSCNNFFSKYRSFSTVIMCAGLVGGIKANSDQPYDFLYQNVTMASNAIDCCIKYSAKQFVYLGSSCLYPPTACIPFREDALLTLPFELSNEWYALAKSVGIKLCASARIQYELDARVLMPTNLYGPGDNYHPENSHVVASLVRKFCTAKMSKKAFVELWGTGQALREVMHADDLANAILHVAQLSQDHFESITTPRLPVLNAGTGEEYTIEEMAGIILKKIGYECEIIFNNEREGVKRKLMDSSKLMNTGFKPAVQFEKGIESAILDFDYKSQL
jgi:GDP-L-fucose synthase